MNFDPILNIGDTQGFFGPTRPLDPISLSFHIKPFKNSLPPTLHTPAHSLKIQGSWPARELEKGGGGKLVFCGRGTPNTRVQDGCEPYTLSLCKLTLPFQV